MSKYDAILNEEMNAAPKKGSSVYDAVLDQEVQLNRQRARAVFESALSANPDHAAESKKLMNTTGLPLAVVERNLEELRRKEQARMLDLARMAEDSPVLSRQLLDPTFTKQAHDDISNLGEIERTILGTAKDVGVTALKGAVGLPQAIVGLADIPTFGYAGKAVQALGVDFARTQRILSGDEGETLISYSLAQQQANKNVEIADGFLNTLSAMLQNPSTIATTVGETLPQLLGGAAAARKILQVGGKSVAAGEFGPQLPSLLVRQFGEKTATVLAGAFGEGLMAAGSAAETMRAENADGLLGVKQVIASLGLGAGTAIFGMGGGRIAQKIGLDDIDTVLASRGLSTEAADQAKQGFVSAVIKSGISESLFEELPQSVQEQMWQNWANDKPLDEGVGKAAAQGMVAGFAMGGGFQAINRAVQRAADIDQSETNAKLLQSAQELAAASKLRERNPDEFRSLVQQMADQTEGAPTEIYVDGDVLNQLAPEALAQLPQAVRDQIPQAAAIGDVVAIPMGDVLTVAPGTVLEQALVDNARIGDPRAMTRKEAQEAGAQAQEFLAQEAQRVMQQAQDQAAVEAEFAAVRDDLKTQIAATQRYSESVSDAYATGLTHFFVAYGSRTGMGTQGLYQAYRDRGFRISAQPTAQAQGQVLNDGALGQTGQFDLSVPEDGNQLRDVKVGDTTISLNARGRFSNPEGVVEVASVRTPQAKRGAGSARAALQALVQQADAQGVTLKLDASPLDRKTRGDKLVAFYESLGFQRTGRSNNAAGEPEMVRQPQQSAQTAGTYTQQANNLKSDIEQAGGVIEDVLQVDQLIDSKDIPTITLQDLVGKAIFPTIADRTAAAALYTGIDSSTTVAIPLLGGPFFPLRESNVQAGVVWANRGDGVIAQKAAKLKEGANYMLVVMGDANMHQSNSTVAAAFLATLDSYIANGRISKKNVKALDAMVRDSGEKAIAELQAKLADADSAVAKAANENDLKKAKKVRSQVMKSMAVANHVKNFPGFENTAKTHAYMDSVSFDARKRVLEIMASKQAINLGAPSMQKILDATREPSLAGHRWGDGVLLVEVDQTNPQVELGTEGTTPHPDFPVGVRGKVIGKLNAPINWQMLWQDWLAENSDKDSPRRAFELAKPIVTVSQDLVDRIGPITQANIDSSRQARLASDFAAGNWRTSDNPVNKGGVSPQEFLDALRMSDGAATLSDYTLDELKAGIKNGTRKIYQLGDGQIYFMLEVRPDGSKYLASVVNNEQGARGIGGPAVVLKALEEGATDLDAFAVPSGKYPEGFLPALYGAFGFEVTERYKFDPKFFKPELPKKQRDRTLADAVEYWTTSTPGFDPKAGMPDAVVMKWSGTNEDRAKITERYLRGGLEGLLAGRVDADVQAAEDELAAPDRQEAGQAAGPDVGGTAGDRGAGRGSSLASRARSTVQGIADLTDNELVNLGLTAADRAAVQRALGRPAAPNANVLEQGPLGTFNPRSLELVLNPDANLSTLWHEMGHFFLEVMADISSQPNAPAQISADFDTFLKWAGTDRAQWTAWQAEYKQTGKINPDLVAIHERWAESIEQYIMEGKVPNAEMQPLMRRFSAWLLDVYKSIKKFLAQRGVGPDGNGTFQQAAFHGTPHRGITKFSTDKIGTGEGAQAYGWGLYFASKKEIAEWYRTTLAKTSIYYDGEPVKPTSDLYKTALDALTLGAEATKEKLRELIARNTERAKELNGKGPFAQVVKNTQARLDWLESIDPAKLKDEGTPGQLYKVEIPEDSDMLLWDKPLSEQPEVVRQAIEGLMASDVWDADTRKLIGNADIQGKKFYEALAGVDAFTGRGEFGKAASEALLAAGIKGIKYLDGTSRGAGDGTFNYVIFSGDDVQITEQFYQGGAQRAANMQLNDDIRRVMDRMLATDEQIQQANEAAGMAPNVEADAEANERLNKRSMADLKWTVKARDKAIKKLQAEAASIRKEIEEQVTLEVNQMPEVLAKEKLDALTIVPEHKVLLDQYKADRQAAIDAAQTEITDLMVAEQEAKEGTLKGLAKGQFLAKSKREIANRVDARMIEWDRANPRPMRPVNVTDMDMAIIADSYEFADVPTMLQAIDAFGNKRDVIEGMTEQRMLEEHGDLIDPRAIEQAANEAVHNEARARSLASELRTQQEMLNPRTDTGQVNAAGSKITVNALVEAAKQFGANVVARTPLKDLRSLSAKHTAAERRAAKRWQEATAKGDTQAAVKAKQDQMLNNAAAKAAIDALEEAKKITEFFKRVVKGNNEKVVEKGRDPDIVNAARAVLAAYGVETPTTKAAADYLETLQRNDPQTYAAIEPMVAGMMSNAQPLQALTFQELQALGEEVNAMWHLAKRSRQMEVDGDLLDVEDVADEVYARMEEIGIPDTVPGETGALTKAEERSRMLQFAGALLRRVEQWAEAKDGKFGGPFLRFIFQPVKDAADRYRADRVVYRKKFQALVDNIAPMMRPGLVEAPELGYTFGRGHNGIGMAELLHAILHTGNGSNKRKLLLGRGWATENADGTLDTSRWDAFIKRLTDTGVLIKAHYDFAQGVWDLMEETKPLAQKTHRDVFGRYFEEITAESFNTPFGTYRGGYVPAQADPLLVQDAELRDLLEGENESMSYSFPSTNKGFTKGRVEYNRPLKLDLRSLPQHLDKVLLFSHMEPAVRGVAKLIKQPKVSQPLGRIDPGAISGLLRPWLNRSARQVVETPVLGDGRISRMASIVRARAGMTLMFANLSNTIQQITGLSTAAVKVKPAHLMRAVANYIANPRKASRAVWDASPYMDDRASNEVAAMNDVIDQILLDPSMLERGQAWTQRHGYFLQTAFDNILSPIIWTGAYNQAVEEGMEERMAIRFADGVVRQTQGSTLPEDVSRFETGPAYARLFTQFVGYFNMMANTNATALKQITGEMGLRKGAGKALYVVTMGLLMPIWVAEAIAQAFRGGPEDEDDDGYLDDWLASVFGFGTIKGIFAQVPIVGQVSQGVVSRFNDNPADDKFSLSPAVSLIESAAGSPASVYKAIVEDGPKQKAVRDVAALVTMATGIPVYAAARPVGYAAGVADDRIEPTGPVDLTRGLVTGTASPESKQR